VQLAKPTLLKPKKDLPLILQVTNAASNYTGLFCYKLLPPLSPPPSKNMKTLKNESKYNIKKKEKRKKEEKKKES